MFSPHPRRHGRRASGHCRAGAADSGRQSCRPCRRHGRPRSGRRCRRGRPVWGGPAGRRAGCRLAAPRGFQARPRVEPRPLATPDLRFAAPGPRQSQPFGWYRSTGRREGSRLYSGLADAAICPFEPENCPSERQFSSSKGQ